ncbi:MAG TPA: 7-cyano-7-deazaguanine synthase QueC [Pseudomonadales bacterium]
MKKAVVLLSGGLDSSTCLAIARDQGYQCYGLSFDYGQKHHSELQAALRIGQAMGLQEHKTIAIDLRAFGGSALTDLSIDVPVTDKQKIAQSGPKAGIPVTYVPARNTIFLSMALGYAEVLQAQAIFIGVNAVDYSGYPDCREEFIQAFEKMANLATKAAVEGYRLSIHTPLISLSKAEIINQGRALGVDYSLTVSCYRADQQGRACGQCESCYLRQQGFKQAGLADPTPYQ